MESIRLNIDELQEPETQDKVREQLEGLIGVLEVSLSEGQNYVDINYDDQTSVEKMISHLHNNGYKVID